MNKICGFDKPRELFVDMTTDEMTTTNAYRLFINRLCRSCPLKIQCPLFNKFTEEQVDKRILRERKKWKILFQERISFQSTSLNHYDVEIIENNLSNGSVQHCFLCLDILHRYTSDEFIQQVNNSYF